MIRSAAPLLVFVMGAFFVLSACGIQTQSADPVMSTPEDSPVPTALFSPARTAVAPEITVVGDLGWMVISGSIYDGAKLRNKGIEDALVTLRHHSIVHPPGLIFQEMTSETGTFEFPPLYLHDSDVLILRAEARGYETSETRRTGLEIFYEHDLSISLQREEPRSERQGLFQGKSPPALPFIPAASNRVFWLFPIN